MLALFLSIHHNVTKNRFIRPRSRDVHTPIPLAHAQSLCVLHNASLCGGRSDEEITFQCVQ